MGAKVLNSSRVLIQARAEEDEEQSDFYGPPRGTLPIFAA